MIQTIDELYTENMRIAISDRLHDAHVKLMGDEPKTITEALLDAWDEFNQEITDRSAQNLYLYNDYARVELFKMMVDLENDKARTSI